MSNHYKEKVGCGPVMERVVLFLFYSFLLIGIGLRMYQYLMGRSLWEDEAHIALNFIKFGHLGLMAPLENFQTAPILFLWIVETFCDVFGSGEMSLRAFPLLISLAALPFMFYVARSLTKSSLAAIIAFIVFTLNITLIYFSSEIKSYTVDVSAYIFIPYLLLSSHPYVVRKRTLLLAIAGAVAIICSNASAVILFCAAIYMVTKDQFDESSSEKRKLLVLQLSKSSIVIFITWGVVWVINYFRFIHNHPYADGMKSIWSWTFSPRNIFRKPFTDFITARINDTIYTDMLFFTDKYYFPQILTCLVVCSVLTAIIRKQWVLLLFTVLPILLHLGVSMLKMYPFFYRFILYLLPPFIILVSYGVASIINYLPRLLRNTLALPVVAAFCYCCSYISIEKFPSWDREIGPVISYINKNHPDKQILVTTPYTLYSYYMERDVAKNKHLQPIKWNLKPEQYYSSDSVKSIKSDYLLLYSVDGFADGYGDVLKSLKENGLILQSFEYKTYGVVAVKPKQ